MLIQPDISSCPAWAVSPGEPLLKPETFLISLPSGEPLSSAGRMVENWTWEVVAMLWIIGAVCHKSAKRVCWLILLILPFSFFHPPLLYATLNRPSPSFFLIGLLWHLDYMPLIVHYFPRCSIICLCLKCHSPCISMTNSFTFSPYFPSLPSSVLYTIQERMCVCVCVHTYVSEPLLISSW